MSNRAWLYLLLGAWLTLTLSRVATAQPPKQSHHPLPGEQDMRDDPALMSERMRELRELHQLQDQVRELLRDPDFISKIKQQFADVTDEQLRQLQEKIFQDGGPGGDSEWNQRLRQAASNTKLDQRQRDILRRWVENSSRKPAPPPSESRPANPSPPPSPAASHLLDPKGTPFLSMEFSQRSFLDQLQSASEKWFSEHVKDLDDETIDTLTEMKSGRAVAPSAELMRAMKQSNLPTAGLIEPASELARYLPDVGELLSEPYGDWDELFSLFREVPGSSLSALGSGPSLPSLASTAPVRGEGSATSLTLLTVGVFMLLLWKMGVGSWLRKDRGDAGDWQPGAWPVAPDAVATRQDLVRAFEHLALLRLGRSASPCHHRELAGRLIGQDAGDPTHRQAIELLAWLYEQARYAPAEESLSPAELSDARQALRYLAGVTTA